MYYINANNVAERVRKISFGSLLTFINTWIDQKVLKLHVVAYLLKYTTELYQTYTEYATTISWFVSVVRMTQCARRYMTSSFDVVMQQWPGVKKKKKKKKKTSKIVFSQRSAITNIYVSCGSYFSEIIIDLTYLKHHRDQILSKYAISLFLHSLVAQVEHLLEKMRKIVPKILTL